MKIRVLGASGSEVPGRNCPSYLVDRSLLLDGGTIALSLNIAEERDLRNVLLTHAHFDHIKAIPFLLDNRVMRGSGGAVTLISAGSVLAQLKEHLFNGIIWPDFHRIPEGRPPVLLYREVSPSRSFLVDGYRVACEAVNHTVPAYGFFVSGEDGGRVAYTGDTGPTERFWTRLSRFRPGLLIVEVSFPNRMEDVALLTGHLTPRLLEAELGRLRRPPARVGVVHVKPQFRVEIARELSPLAGRGVVLLEDGDVLEA